MHHPRPAFEKLAEVCLFALLVLCTLTVSVKPLWPALLLKAGVLLFGTCTLILAQPARGPGYITQVLLFTCSGWGALQVIADRTVYRYETIGAVLHWLTVGCLVLIGRRLFEREKARMRFLLTFGAFAALVAAWSLVQQFTSEGRILWLFPTGFPDVFGPFVYRNNFAALLELAVPVTVWAAFRIRHRAYLYTGMTAVMVAAVVSSASRMGTLLVLLEIMAVSIYCFRQQRFGYSLSGTIQLAVLVAFVLVAGGWDTVAGRFREADPLNGRREIMQGTWHMSISNPLFGTGLGTFQTAYPRYAVFDNGTLVNHAHNDWMEWAAEGGLPFLFLIATAFATAVPAAFRTGWGVGVIGVCLHAFFDYPMQRLGVAGWIFVFLPLLAAADSRPIIRSACKPGMHPNNTAVDPVTIREPSVV